MCLAIPARVVEVNGDQALIEVLGVRHAASLALLEGVQVGDYVLLHAGFALHKWTAPEAREQEALLQEVFAAEENEPRRQAAGG
ncbi:MAG: HypC/HybG/HupF family hydrogenase formation chaperone [Kiritimatiellaeota bacterium]|nr:HypC/HybG/HupF family hydrogenase formation chaperone [Kiritimatiellota bacterium]